MVTVSAQVTGGPNDSQFTAIYEALSEREPRTMYEVAEMLDSTYWTLYPYFRKMEEMGMIQASPFRKDKKKTFIRADLSKTPKIHLQGRDADPVPLYKVAGSAVSAKKAGTTTGEFVNNFPYMALRLYSLAASVEAGHDYDRAVFQGIRGDMVQLRNRLENMIGAINELLAHPVMSGNSTVLVDSLLNDTVNPLTRDKIQELMKEAE